MKNYKLYFVDCETDGLDSIKNSIIEVSILRMEDEEQKTWCIRPFNIDNIELGALRKNGHKIEDLKGETPYGRLTYRNPSEVIVEIENWIMMDNVPAEDRILGGHNTSFDKAFLEQLWLKCNSKDTFPFGRRYLDTMIIQLFWDYCKNEFAEGYSLANLVKRYSVKNEKSHTAASDTKATKEVFVKQIELFRKILAVNA